MLPQIIRYNAYEYYTTHYRKNVTKQLNKCKYLLSNKTHSSFYHTFIPYNFGNESHFNEFKGNNYNGSNVEINDTNQYE